MSESVQKRVVLEVRAADGSWPKSGDEQNTKWIFAGDSLSIGRSGEFSDLALATDTALSKQHFKVQFDGQLCIVTDLDSTNGTRVNGEFIQPAVVAGDGDQITAGTSTFRVRIVGDEAVSAPPDGSVLSGIVTLRLVTEGEDEDAETALLSRLMTWIRPGQFIVIGSDGYTADWSIPAEWELAPSHFRISYDGHRCFVERLHEAHPIAINGEEVKRAEVKDNDRITAAKAMFRVQIA